MKNNIIQHFFPLALVLHTMAYMYAHNQNLTTFAHNGIYGSFCGFVRPYFGVQMVCKNYILHIMCWCASSPIPYRGRAHTCTQRFWNLPFWECLKKET